MNTIKGPGIFLAQFAAPEPPFNTLGSVAKWAHELGFKGVQIPTWSAAYLDLALAAESRVYCDELRGKLAEQGVVITELSSHVQGQMIAVHPAFDALFDGLAPRAVRGNPAARAEWARQQLSMAARASANLQLQAHATFSGALLWPFVYPWPQRPAGLVAEGFKELAHRWRPILDEFDERGVDVCFEIHPGEDLHDGVSFERFLDAVGQHRRANILYDPSHLRLQQIDYVGFIEVYHERIKMFHVKDAEFRPTARTGAWGGYVDWIDRAGRFRSLGDGDIRFREIFSRLTQHDFEGWAVLEWECCLKHPADGAREGAAFIADHIIHVTDKAFDDFSAGALDADTSRRILGLAS